MGDAHASDPRFAAFYGLLVTESRISERLDAELQAAAGVSLNRLELLVHLRFKDGRWWMSGLAGALLFSRGVATRLVARAEEDGLVRREIPPDDRRATYAVLTDTGIEAAERGYPVYLDVVQRLFQDFVTDEEADVLVRVWARVLEGNGMACAPIQAAAACLEETDASSSGAR
jgi:DNA-binding MarR family transcriptional regulator